MRVVINKKNICYSNRLDDGIELLKIKSIILFKKGFEIEEQTKLGRRYSFFTDEKTANYVLETLLKEGYIDLRKLTARRSPKCIENMVYDKVTYVYAEGNKEIKKEILIESLFDTKIIEKNLLAFKKENENLDGDLPF